MGTIANTIIFMIGVLAFAAMPSPSLVFALAIVPFLAMVGTVKAWNLDGKQRHRQATAWMLSPFLYLLLLSVVRYLA